MPDTLLLASQPVADPPNCSNEVEMQIGRCRLAAAYSKPLQMHGREEVCYSFVKALV